MAREDTPLLAGDSKGSSAAIAVPPAVDPTWSNVIKFRRAIGINSDVKGDSSDLESARKHARGFYANIISTQKWRSWQYHFVEFMYYLVIVTQVLVGALLTALGPLGSLGPAAITILGVVNTCSAGLLALLKGQGLPDRLRKDQYELKKVQDYIEETETRLSLGEGTFTDDQLDEVVQKIFLKYNAARDSAEMNRPDTYGHQAEGETQPRAASSETNREGLVTGNGKGKGQVVLD